MSCYIVAFELGTDSNQPKLTAYFKAQKHWARIANSVWAIVTDAGAEAIREALLPFIGTDGRLFVVRSGVESAWARTRCSSEWLRKHL